MTVYPKIFRLRQRFPRVRVDDVPVEVHRQLEVLSLERKIRPGQRVAITAGSRGIAHIVQILRAVVDFVRVLGADPVIVPAMGSHGGATAEGQREILRGYGITEASCGCPIQSSMETVVVCRSELGFPVHFDRHAFQADHVLLCGRIKPHTQFSGPVESGLLKMLLVGLGKHAGAKTYHAAFQDYGFDRIVHSVAGTLLDAAHVAGGLAVIENAYDETARLVGVPPEAMLQREAELLRLARRWMASLPFPAADVLIVDQIGKNISGTGLDTNVVGRKEGAEPSGADDRVRVKRILVRGLTAESRGNATGIGLADFCTRQLAGAVDRRSTWVNGITACHLEVVKLPPEFATDREALDAALTTIGLTPAAEARLQWISNTRDLTEVECSAAYLPAARDRDDLEVLTGLRDLPFDPTGNLPASVARLT